MPKSVETNLFIVELYIALVASGSKQEAEKMELFKTKCNLAISFAYLLAGYLAFLGEINCVISVL
jgi:hypothetical protein